MTVQILRTDAGEELVVLTRRDYDALLARAGDEAAEDRMTARIVAEGRASGEPSWPAWLAEAVIAGSTPIRAARERSGLSIEDLAERLGLRPSLVGEIEAGLIDADDRLLEKIAATTGVDAAWLRS